MKGCEPEGAAEDVVEEVIPGGFMGFPTVEHFGVHAFLESLASGAWSRWIVEFVWLSNASTDAEAQPNPNEPVFVVLTGGSNGGCAFNDFEGSDIRKCPGVKEFPNMREACVYLRLKLAR